MTCGGSCVRKRHERRARNAMKHDGSETAVFGSSRLVLGRFQPSFVFKAFEQGTVRFVRGKTDAVLEKRSSATRNKARQK
jgi:hypothetical protein